MPAGRDLAWAVLALAAPSGERPGVQLIGRARDFLDQGLWFIETRPRTFAKWGIGALQLLVVIGQGFVQDRLIMRAHSLTYFTVLSLIPLLALALSIVHVLGISANLAELVVSRVAAGSPEAVDRIVEMVKQVQFGRLGTVGAAILLTTTVLGLGNVERALNDIWGVKRSRGLGRRFADYLAVIVVAPVLLALALSLTTTFRSQTLVARFLEYPIFVFFWESGLRQLPALLLVVCFALLYWFLPNTRVRVGAALLGGATAAFLFLGAEALYVGFSVGAARSNALFGGFAALPLLLVWIFISWAIVLLGAEVAFAYQNLNRYRLEVRGARVGTAARETIAVSIALDIAARFRDGATPRLADELADLFDASVRNVREILARFTEAGIVSEVEHDGAARAYQLARPAESIRVADLLSALRGPRSANLSAGSITGEVNRMFGELDRQEREATDRETLADLLANLHA